MPLRMHAHELEVDERLVRRLLAAQLPALADLPLRIVEPWGTDNAIWRLGDDLVVRIPRITGAADQVGKEARWLPHLAPHLSVPLPEPVAVGDPTEEHPLPWAVHRWLPGVPAAPDTIADLQAFATDLARTVVELRSVPVEGAPPAVNRARPVQVYDDAARRSIDAASALIDADTALDLWEQALAAAPHGGPPVWVHGDLEGNCLLVEGRLAGLVDWGLACAGDPAVDVQVAWSPLFTVATRDRFLDLIGADEATIARARGAAVQQACAALPYYLRTYPLIVERSRHKLEALGVEVRLPAP